jgi:hypothetical protein
MELAQRGTCSCAVGRRPTDDRAPHHPSRTGGASRMTIELFALICACISLLVSLYAYFND